MQPQPFPVVARIPEDQPFVVRPGVGKRAAVFGGVVAFITLMLACMLGLGSIGTGDTGPVLFTAAGFAVLMALIFGFQLWLLVSGGPVLAVGPHGLWIKTRPTRGQAIWLPWEAIGMISRRRWSLEKMLCVQPRDPRADANLGAFTAVDAVMQKAFFGTGFTATLNFADKREEEILAAVAHFAAGRVHLR